MHNYQQMTLVKWFLDCENIYLIRQIKNPFALKATSTMFFLKIALQYHFFSRRTDSINYYHLVEYLVVYYLCTPSSELLKIFG